MGARTGGASGFRRRSLRRSPRLTLPLLLLAVHAGGAGTISPSAKQCAEAGHAECSAEPSPTTPLQEFDQGSLGELWDQMRLCADSLFHSGDVPTVEFFSRYFEQHWVHLRDTPRSGQPRRAQVCASLFPLAGLRPIIAESDPLFLSSHVKLASHRQTSAYRCSSNADCLQGLDEKDTTVVVNELEFYRPAPSMLTRELKRKLGIWVHMNAYYTPAGGHHGFGLHTDNTDGLVLQLAGKKRWDICGFTAVGSKEYNLMKEQNIGTPHRDPAVHAKMSPAMQALYSDCSTVTLTAGDVLYMPSGTVHMAWSTADAVRESRAASSAVPPARPRRAVPCPPVPCLPVPCERAEAK